MHREQNKFLRKQFGFCLHEKCCTLINHLCNLDGPLAFEREGHVFPVKDKPRTLTSIIKDSSTAWLSEERSHQLTTWFVADANRNSQQFWMLITKQVKKLAQSIGSRAECGRHWILGLSTARFCHLQLKSKQQLLYKTFFLQKSSSIKNICNKLNIQSSLPTESCINHKRTAFL